MSAYDSLPQAFLASVSVALLILTSCGNPNHLAGTKLSNHEGYSYSLVDHRGRVVTNSSSKSKITVLTFMFTRCTDVCPIVTSNIRTALGDGLATERVQVHIVTVDPEQDTPEAMSQFVEKWNLSSNWSFISGKEQDLRPIWNSYFVNPVNSNGSPKTGIDSLKSALDRRYKVIHTAPVFILDKDGVARVLHTNPIKPMELAKDIEIIGTR